MARPKREGLDYFPLDVNAGIDDEIELLEAEHGLEGFAIFIKLLQKIYKNSYYIMWTEKEQLQFSKRVNVDINQVNVIIMSCLKWGLLNKELFDSYEILTSRGVQKRFLFAKDRRTTYEFYEEYLLLTENEVNAYKNVVIVCKTTDNVVNNPQSKVKESKVKESKEKEKETECFVISNSSDKTIEACKYFESAGFGTINQIVMQKMEDLVTRFSFQWVKEAIDTSVIRGKRKLSYVEGILINWKTEGREENKQNARYASNNTGNNTDNQQDKVEYDFNKPYTGPSHEGEEIDF